MRKQIQINKENNRGITLIALVMTIIVLLILAGVTIAMLTGENGLIKRAETAKEETLIAQYKERINLIKGETGIKNENRQKYWVNKTEIKNGIIELTTNDEYLFFVTEGITQYKGAGNVITPEIITAEMVEFIPEDSTWTGITNVKEALDYLYNNQ